MKKLLLVASVLCAGFVLAEQVGPAAKKRMFSAERKARIQARITADGGLISRPKNGKVIRLMTKTDKVPVADLEITAAEITDLMGLAVECVDGTAQTSQRTGCLIVVNEQEKGPTLLIAPEDPWASINIKNLMTDNPASDLFKTRVKKEIWRAFGYAMGAANSNMQPCLMRPIYGIKELDAEEVAILCPEPLSGIAMSANRLNIAQNKMCTYKRACEEGWAPAPTNDVQKAIWKKVHAIPDKPLKIQFDPATQKGKVAK